MAEIALEPTRKPKSNATKVAIEKKENLTNEVKKYDVPDVVEHNEKVLESVSELPQLPTVAVSEIVKQPISQNTSAVYDLENQRNLSNTTHELKCDRLIEYTAITALRNISKTTTKDCEYIKFVTNPKKNPDLSHLNIYVESLESILKFCTKKANILDKSVKKKLNIIFNKATKQVKYVNNAKQGISDPNNPLPTVVTAIKERPMRVDTNSNITKNQPEKKKSFPSISSVTPREKTLQEQEKAIILFKRKQDILKSMSPITKLWFAMKFRESDPNKIGFKTLTDSNVELHDLLSKGFSLSDIVILFDIKTKEELLYIGFAPSFIKEFDKNTPPQLNSATLVQLFRDINFEWIMKATNTSLRKMCSFGFTYNDLQNLNFQIKNIKKKSTLFSLNLNYEELADLGMDEELCDKLNITNEDAIDHKWPKICMEKMGIKKRITKYLPLPNGKKITYWTKEKSEAIVN